MSGQRYTPEFKDEAVKCVTQKGHSVADFALFMEFILQMILEAIVASSVTAQAGVQVSNQI